MSHVIIAETLAGGEMGVRELIVRHVNKMVKP